MSIALADAQDQTSDRIMSKRLAVSGNALRLFQIHHAESMIIDDAPMRKALGVDRVASSHHSTKSSSLPGGLVVDRI
jgi:hypothetical protein